MPSWIKIVQLVFKLIGLIIRIAEKFDDEDLKKDARTLLKEAEFGGFYDHVRDQVRHYARRWGVEAMCDEIQDRLRSEPPAEDEEDRDQ